MPTGADERTSGSHGHRRVAIWAAVVVGVLLILAIRLALSAVTLRQRALDVADSVLVVVGAVSEGDRTRASYGFDDAVKAVDGLRSEVNSPIWDVAGIVPGPGHDVVVARGLVNSLADTFDAEIAPLKDDVCAIDLGAFAEGRGVEMTMRIRSVVAALESPLASLRNDIASREPFSIGAVERLAARADSALDDLHSTYESKGVNGIVGDVVAVAPLAHAVAPLIPDALDLLGFYGPRDYLLLAFTNAEQRSAGGFPGAWVPVSVENGHIELGEVTSITNEGTYDFLGMGYITPEESEAFYEGRSLNPGDTMILADFPRAAEVGSRFWGLRRGQEVDGVLALNPSFLQGLVKATGPVSLPDGKTLDGENLASYLMHDVYIEHPDNKSSDAVFSAVARACFAKLTDGAAVMDLKVAGDEILASIARRDVMFWSADPAIQRNVAQTALAGQLTFDEQEPELGVYVVDFTWSKSGWYLDVETELGQPTTLSDGSERYDVTLRIHNIMTEREAEELPAYITGMNPEKRSPGDLITNLIVLGPAGGSIEDVDTLSMRSANTHRFNGVDSLYCMSANEPGEVTEITFEVTTSPLAQEPLRVRQTTPARDFSVLVDDASALREAA